MGILVGVDKMVCGSVRLNNITRIKAIPLCSYIVRYTVRRTDKIGQECLRYSSNCHRRDHGNGGISCRSWHFFSQMGHSVEADQRQSRLKQTQDPSHAITPAGRIGEIGKDIFCMGFFRSGQDRGTNDDACENRPQHYQSQSCSSLSCYAWEALLNRGSR